MDDYNIKNKKNQSKNKKLDIVENFTVKKLANERLLTLIVKHVSLSAVERLKICSTFIELVGNIDLTKKKLNKSNFCGNRFCPACAWRKSRKEAIMLDVLMKYIAKEHNKRFLFLTLTVVNVRDCELNETIQKFNKDIQKMFQRLEVKKMNFGYIRKFEITYNKKQNTYHPHAHLILAVNKSYFTDKKIYINRNRFLEIWKDVTGDERITQVDIRAVKEDLTTDKTKYEIAKYTAKDVDYLHNQNVFDTFYTALSGKRLLSYTGLFKEAVKLYKDKQLEHYKDIDNTEYIYKILYLWGFGNYVEKELKELTDEEKKKINKQLLDEDDDME